MGNSSNQQESRTITIVNHENFREYQVHDLPSSPRGGSQLMRTCLPIQYDTLYFEWEENLNKLADSLDDQNFLLPKGYQFVRNTLCGSSGLLNADYDSYPYILEDEISNRNPLNKYFQQEQVWYLLYILVASAQEFYRFQKKLGDIRPSNIFINDTGQVKTSCLYSFPGGKTNYEKTLMQREETYLSPEEAVEIKSSYSKPMSDPEISQSFSIGVSILHVGLLQKMGSLYSFSTGKNPFDGKLLEKYLQKWMNLDFYSIEKEKKLRYSDPLKYTVLGLCDPDPLKRLNSKKVYEWLRPHEVDIVNLHQFETGVPPYYPKSRAQLTDERPRNISLSPELKLQKFPTFQQKPSERSFSPIIISSGRNVQYIEANRSEQSPSGRLTSQRSPIINTQSISLKPHLVISSSKNQAPNITQSHTPNSKVRFGFQSGKESIQQTRGQILSLPKNLGAKQIAPYPTRGSIMGMNSNTVNPQELHFRRSVEKAHFTYSNPNSQRYANQFVPPEQVRSFMGSMTGTPVAKNQIPSNFANISIQNQNKIRNTHLNFPSHPKTLESKTNQASSQLHTFRNPNFALLNKQTAEAVSFDGLVTQQKNRDLSESIGSKNGNQPDIKSMLKRIDQQVLKSQNDFPSHL